MNEKINVMLTKDDSHVAKGYATMFYHLYSDHQIRKAVFLSKTYEQGEPKTMDMVGLFHIWEMVRATSILEGDIAEVGVFFGRSAQLIAIANDSIKSLRKIYLFDTFAGNPVDEGHDMPVGSYACDIDIVKGNLEGYSNIILCKGLFPQDTLHYLDDVRLSFIHLDVDTYRYTKAALEALYPKLVRGGMIMIHDFPFRNVGYAVREFFKDKKTPIIELGAGQGLIVKVED